ncbi:MAG: 3'(2'),5'-bisphosphate nucleotidase CysQ [Deltaproteobacteria bacterium]|nr:3'(2'),5'-bisphosphate nucleotidase CysQ [Deltaproteobacteria bacterium]MBW2634965.1 3'(2'),5'-bisphosphate nucleotidase CysQ [Deltaproteobacteria bacterium]MBW2676619.1 3'(2'),5'-bisphosphate nucleotidase CysQ [Deltaproteobacteria bacterium]
MKNDKYLLHAIQAAVDAGKAVLEVYHSDFDVDYKADNSPLTLADKKAHDIISGQLAEFEIPLLSEEGKAIPFDTRRTWDTLWIIDPLDGTKEFVKRNGEFTVNIALVTAGKPVLGVVFAPVRKFLYFAMQSLGAFKMEGMDTINAMCGRIARSTCTTVDLVKQSISLPIGRSGEQPYTIVGSRSHATEALENFVDQKRSAFGSVDFIPAGSSLKLCLVAEGRADIYPRLAPTMEWDTAAGHAVAECAGARIYEHPSGIPLVYNKENLLNPWFIVER